MWILLVIAAAVLLSGGSGTQSQQTVQTRIGPDRETAALYVAMCEFWREGIYEPRALTLATALALRPERSVVWNRLAAGMQRDPTNPDHRYWELVAGVADAVAARPSLLCANKGRR